MRARTAASVVIAAALLLGTTGCSFFSTQTTLKPYDASDGVGATVGNVDVRNAILLTKDDQEASFLVNFINDGEKAVTLLVQYTGTTADGSTGKVNEKIPLKPGEVKTFGSEDTDQLVFNGIGSKPGTVFPVWVQYGSGTGKQMLVPVLDGSLDEYANLLPTPTPTPTMTPTPSGSSTPSNSDAPTPTNTPTN